MMRILKISDLFWSAVVSSPEPTVHLMLSTVEHVAMQVTGFGCCMLRH